MIATDGGGYDDGDRWMVVVVMSLYSLPSNNKRKSDQGMVSVRYRKLLDIVNCFGEHFQFDLVQTQFSHSQPPPPLEK